MDQAHGLGFLRLHALALHQHVHQRVLDAQHAHHTGDTAAARQQAQGHFRQAELCRLVVDGHAVMAGQGDFQTTAQRGAVERRNDRLAQGFDDTQLALDLCHPGQKALGVFLFGFQQVTQVAAGKEGFLRGGDDDTGDVVLFLFQTLDHGRHGTAIQLVHGVGGLVRIIQRQRHDVVRVFFPTDGCLFTHAFSPDSFNAAFYKRSMMVAIPMPPPTHRVHRP